MSLMPHEIPNPGTLGNGQALRQKMAYLTQALGVIAQSAGGQTDTAKPVFAMLKYMQALVIPRMITAPTYPTKAFADAAAVTAVGATLPTDCPSVVALQITSATRQELIRMMDVISAASLYSGNGKTDQADVVFSMIEAVLTDIGPLRTPAAG